MIPFKVINWDNESNKSIASGYQTQVQSLATSLGKLNISKKEQKKYWLGFVLPSVLTIALAIFLSICIKNHFNGMLRMLLLVLLVSAVVGVFCFLTLTLFEFSSFIPALNGSAEPEQSRFYKGLKDKEFNKIEVEEQEVDGKLLYTPVCIRTLQNKHFDYVSFKPDKWTYKKAKDDTMIIDVENLIAYCPEVVVNEDD